MAEPRAYAKGETVYRVDGREVTKHVISRTTATMAYLILPGAREEKFSRRDGWKLPRANFARGASIAEASPELEQRYRASERRRVARLLSYAAEQFHRGDDRQEERITELHTQWAALGASTQTPEPEATA